MCSLVIYSIYGKCCPDYAIKVIKYLEVFEVVIIYKVCSVYSICDTMTLTLEIIPNIDIPFGTPKTQAFLTKLLFFPFFL